MVTVSCLGTWDQTMDFTLSINIAVKNDGVTVIDRSAPRIGIAYYEVDVMKGCPVTVSGSRHFSVKIERVWE